MNFIKSSLAKKILLILIAILLFNFAIPQEVKAAGIVESILFKPLASLLYNIVVSVEALLGMVINGVGGGFDAIGDIIDKIGSGDENAMKQLFVGPDTIFSGRVKILNANIFSDVEATSALTTISGELSGGIGSETVNKVRAAIAGVYVILRNICGLVMLCGLLYTGIQILISSNIPTKKTQYLMLIQDWLIGMALLIFSHIIMIFVFYISDAIGDAFESAVGGDGLMYGLIKKAKSSLDNGESYTTILALGINCYLFYLTGFFAIAYFKRFMWTGILVVISPIVSVMYAFGQQTKQIYSKWLREYVMNVFIQPFHIIVYYVLVAVPIGTLDGDMTSLFSILYAILSIALMKHFEKYIRDLFGFTGMSAQASLESGKSTVNAVKEKVEDVRDKATAVAMVAGKAMLGIPPSGEDLNSLTETGTDSGYWDGLIMDHNDLDEKGRPKIKTRDEYEEQYGKEALDNLLEKNGHTVPRDETGTEETYPVAKPGEQLDELEYNAGVMASAVLADAAMDQTGDDFKEAIAEGVIEGNESVNNKSNNNGENDGAVGKGGTPGAVGAIGDGSVSTSEELEELEKEKKALSGQKSGISRKISKLDAEYRQIAPDAMNGLEDDEVSVGKKDRANEILRQRAELVAQRDAISERQTSVKDQINSLKETTSIPANSGAASGGSNNEQNTAAGAGTNANVNQGQGGGGTISAGNVTINAGSIKIEGQLDGSALQGLRIANNGEIEAKDGDNTKNKDGKATGTGDDELSKVSITNGKNSFDINQEHGAYFDRYQKLEKAGARGRVANEIYKGANQVLDTFAISPADTSWKQTADIRERRIGRSEEKRHAEMERVKASWAGDKTNIQTLAAQFMPQMREAYAGKPEGYIKMQAEEKAKGRLKEMSEYVQYGITDVNVAHKLYEDQRNFGLTPIETIKERAAFEKFDNQAGNVSNINVSNQYVGNNYQTVSQAIPGAREYYNAGYSKVDQMMWLDFMASRLNKTPDMAIKIDQTLRKKGGKINYSGSNKELQDVIKQINALIFNRII